MHSLQRQRHAVIVDILSFRTSEQHEQTCCTTTFLLLSYFNGVLGQGITLLHSQNMWQLAVWIKTEAKTCSRSTKNGIRCHRKQLKTMVSLSLAFVGVPSKPTSSFIGKKSQLIFSCDWGKFA